MHSKPKADTEEDAQDEKEEEEDTESCPSLAQLGPRPRNLRMASRWANKGAPPPHPAPAPRTPEEVTPTEEVVKAQDALAERLYAAYRALAGLPVPHLLRPVCQWLGLRWLGKENEAQAGRYFGQAVGLSASSLYASILCARAKYASVRCRNAVGPRQYVNEPLFLIFLEMAPTKTPYPPCLPQQHRMKRTVGACSPIPHSYRLSSYSSP